MYYVHILFYLLFKSKIYYSVSTLHMENVYAPVTLAITITQEKSGYPALSVVSFFKFKMCA